MSGVVSAVSTVFSSVAQTATNIGSSIMGVGASMFTAGAAGAGTSALSGTLGNIVTGALSQAAIGALAGGVIGAATGSGFGKGAMMGGIGGAITGGLMGATGAGTNPFSSNFGQQGPAASVSGSGIAGGANTPTGFAPMGATGDNLAGMSRGMAPGGGGFAATPSGFSGPSGLAGATNAGAGAAAASGQASSGGFGSFLTSETGGNLLAGLGKGAMAYYEAQQQREAQEANNAAAMARDEAQRGYLREDQQRITDSYKMGDAALNQAPVVDATGRPVPSQKYARPRYQYDPAQNRIVLA